MTTFSKGIRVPAKLDDLRALVESLKDADGESWVRIEENKGGLVTRWKLVVEYEEKPDEPTHSHISKGGHLHFSADGKPVHGRTGVTHAPGAGGEDAMRRLREIFVEEGQMTQEIARHKARLRNHYGV